MSMDDHEWFEMAMRDEYPKDAGRQAALRRGPILGILVAALLVAEFAKNVFLPTGRGDWLAAGWILYCAGLACLPFLLARIAPRTVSFDTSWLPGSRWHWVWFLGMVILMFVGIGVVASVMISLVGHPTPRPFWGPVTPTGIIFIGIVAIFAGPLAEEIFFRGYVLEQLRKLTYTRQIGPTLDDRAPIDKVYKFGPLWGRIRGNGGIGRRARLRA